MKLNKMIITVLFFFSMMGCQENINESPDMHAINSQLINSYNDIALENAIISQHTIYPYHFVQNKAELNELGKRDLNVLTGHFLQQAGYLNIRRLNTPMTLYEARINAIYYWLQEAGIDMERMIISDDMPGGSGIASEKILIILSEKESPATSEALIITK